MLKDTKLVPEFNISALAELSEGQSGSDLKEMCRNAAMVPVREYVRGAAVNQDILAKGQLEVRMQISIGKIVAKDQPPKSGLQSTTIGSRGFLCIRWDKSVA